MKESAPEILSSSSLNLLPSGLFFKKPKFHK